MILYGAGAFLLKVLHTARAAGRAPQACFTEPIEPSPPLPISSLGPYDPTYRVEAPLFLAFADNTIRRNLFRRIRHRLDEAIIHPTAQVDSSARIGLGTFIGARVWIGPETTIDALVIIEEGAIISAGVRIAEGAYIGPSCRVESGTMLGACAYLGMGATIEPDPASSPLYIGEGTVIAPRTQVRRAYPPFSWVSSEKSWPAS